MQIRGPGSTPKRRLSWRARRERWLVGVLVLVVLGSGVGMIAVRQGSSRHRPPSISAQPVAEAGLTIVPAPARIDPAAPREPRDTLTPRAYAEARRIAALGLPVFCGGIRRRMVAFTFDDGPGVYTHYAIRYLTAAHLGATFFLVGRSIANWPGWAEREARLAAIGDHTMTHPFLPGLPLAAATAEIVGARRLIAATVHRPIVLFRPPYGSHTPALDALVRRLGMVDVLWDVDSQDSLGAGYLGIEHNVIAGLAPGSIILMHENRGQTIRALPVILAALRRRHLLAVSLLRMLALDPPTVAQLRRGYDGCPVQRRAGAGG